LVRAWKDNALEPEKYGFGADSILSKEDFFVGDTEGFQNDILSAIQFLQVNPDDPFPIQSIHCH
jgi:hypothetical protein